jgi:predicted secreted protein
MPASQALSGFGTLLKIGDGGGTEVFTSIAEVTDIQGPSFKLDTQDVTGYTSPGGWREKIPGLLDAGDVKLTLSFLPTNATHSQSTGLLRDMKNKTKRNFQLVFPDGGSTTWAFAAYVTGFDVKTPIDNRMQADATLTVTGQPTLAG